MYRGDSGKQKYRMPYACILSNPTHNIKLDYKCWLPDVIPCPTCMDVITCITFRLPDVIPFPACMDAITCTTLEMYEYIGSNASVSWLPIAFQLLVLLTELWQVLSKRPFSSPVSDFYHLAPWKEFLIQKVRWASTLWLLVVIFSWWLVTYQNQPAWA